MKRNQETTKKILTVKFYINRLFSEEEKGLSVLSFQNIISIS